MLNLWLYIACLGLRLFNKILTFSLIAHMSHMHILSVLCGPATNTCRVKQNCGKIIVWPQCSMCMNNWTYQKEPAMLCGCEALLHYALWLVAGSTATRRYCIVSPSPKLTMPWEWQYGINDLRQTDRKTDRHQSNSIEPRPSAWRPRGVNYDSLTFSSCCIWSAGRSLLCVLLMASVFWVTIMALCVL